jgi:hypothetical protein
MSEIKPWNVELENMPHFSKSMERINAWLEGAVVDRAPIRFSQHNSDYVSKEYNKTWPTIKDRWMDTEFIVNDYINRLGNKPLRAETFPVFFPNLGPNWYAGCYGAQLVWGEVTSWAEPIIEDYDKDMPCIGFDREGELFRKMDEITDYALSICKGKFMVGYTDLHPGMDCAVALRGTQTMLLDFIDQPEKVMELVAKCQKPFFEVYDYFDAKLKAHGLPSATWMTVPSFGKLHIPSSDFSAMISTADFDRFVFPILEKECEHFTHNIFHIDGKYVKNHTCRILELPNLQAIQWVQGLGDDEPIMQWVPYLKSILQAKKSIIIDLKKSEVEPFISAFDKPDGIMLCIASDNTDEQEAIIKRVQKW